MHYLAKNMAGKPFSQVIYNADDNAKHQIIEWLMDQGFLAWVNPDDYGIDVLATRGGTEYAFEVEVKHNWDTDVFPFSTVHFSARKKKFIAVNHFFTMLNHARTIVLIVDAPTLQAAPVVSKKTKYTEMEDFIEVRAMDCVIRSLVGF